MEDGNNSGNIINNRTYNYKCKESSCIHTYIGYSASGSVTGALKEYVPYSTDYTGYICVAKMKNLTYGVVGMLAQR